MLDPNFVKSYDDENKLQSTYHKGMIKIWNGRDIISELSLKYPDVLLSDEKKKALTNVLSLIVWGEYAAWQTSSALAFEIEDFGGKMAATSQAHDEARHYFTMCDYMKLNLDASLESITISKNTRVGLNSVVNAQNLTKKLLGMQLMVEPVAISIFYMLREENVDPFLTELLDLYIRDEARHIALGVKHLPNEINKMSWPQVLDLMFWQTKLLKREIDGLFELKDDLEILGINFVKLFDQAEKRQVDAAKEMASHLGWSFPIDKMIKKVTTQYMKAKFKGWL